MPGNPKPEDEDTLVAGASEADARKPIDFEPDRSAGPGKPGSQDRRSDPPDAAELAGTKRRDGEADADEASAGAVSPAELSAENDDGAG